MSRPRRRRLPLVVGAVIAAVIASATPVAAVTSTSVGVRTATSSNSNLSGLTIRWELFKRTGTGKCADYELRGSFTWNAPPTTGWWTTAGDTVPDPDAFELDMQLPTGYVLTSSSATASWRDLQKGTTTSFTPTRIDETREVVGWTFKEMQGHGERTLSGWKHYKRYTTSGTFRVYFSKSVNCASTAIHDLAVKARYIRTIDDAFRDWSFSLGIGYGAIGLGVSVTPTTNTAAVNPSSWSTYLVR